MAAYTTIKKPLDYFNTKLYSGNGSSQSITGVGFQPDWTWIKCRNDGKHHSIYDSVRGVTKYISSNLNTAEQTNSGGVTAFDADGFSVGNFGDVNASFNFASWNWKAGGSSTTNPSGGTITTTASVNTTAGFSVFTYTGTGNAAHIAHGLGAAPTVVIIKGRSNTDQWFVKHPGLNANQYIYLNGTGAATSGANVWSATNPDATKIYIGTDAGVNGSGVTYVCYAFAEKRGYSKFGTYTGNNNSDGVFIYTGFRPAWGMFKRTDSTSDWMIMDDARNAGYRDQPVYKPLLANTDAAESSSYASYQCDFVSNGFKVRNTLGNQNASGTYLFMAFAELPLVGDNPAPAR